MSRQDRWSWFFALQQKTRRLKSASRAFGRGYSLSRRLHVETLEDRRMLAVITVTSTVDNVLPDGAVTLREAIQAANTNASVDGSVAGSGADTILFDSALSDDTITLGGAELEITEALTIDATLLAQIVTIDAQQNSRIFNITATTGDFTLAGLTLTGGRTTGDNVYPAQTFSGGAIRSLSTGSLTIDRSAVSGNSTMGVRARGGGIFSSGAVTLTNSTVSGNSTGGSYAAGGGVYSDGAVTLTDSIISGNSTASNNGIGGGIFSYGAVTLSSSAVIGNSTAGSQAGSGGLFSVGDVLLKNSTVSGNSTAGSFSEGGGIRSAGDITLTNSTVSGNSTAGSSAVGGGIWSLVGDVKLTNSTITDNHTMHANSDGGGIWIDSGGGIAVNHTIVSGNTAGGGTSPDLRPGGSPFTANFSLLGTMVFPGAGSSDNIFNNNPLLGPLAAYGGPTETHSLLAGSPAIDAGDPSFDTGAIPFDQRGAPFKRGSGTRVDIGAYERQIVFDLNLTVDTNVDENDGDYSAGDLSLREAVGLANGSLGAETITFAASLSGDTIGLGGTEIEITEALTFDATALAQSVTVDANNSSRIFNITAATGDFTLAGLTLTGGRTTGISAAFGGGAIRSLTSGNLTLDQSTVSGNSTAGDSADGGGISSSGDVTLASSTVSGNSTAGSGADGGGIWSSFGNFGAVRLINSTITDNHTTHANSEGGGIWINSGSLSPPIIRHSIVSGNSAGSGNEPDIHSGTGTLSANFSLLGTMVSVSQGNGNIFNNNPQLGLLADNGGPTETHALLFGSPAIDAGDPNFTSPPDFDQRGAPYVRVFGDRIDIGALEEQPIVVDSADFDSDGDIDGADFLAWQRGFGILAPNASPSDGDANGDQAINGVDLGIWESQFGLPAPVAAATVPLAAEPLVTANLIDAAMAIGLAHVVQVTESSPLDEEPNFAETYTDHAFASEAFVPTAIVDESEPLDSRLGDISAVEAPWLADELLERVFG